MPPPAHPHFHSHGQSRSSQPLGPRPLLAHRLHYPSEQHTLLHRSLQPSSHGAGSSNPHLAKSQRFSSALDQPFDYSCSGRSSLDSVSPSLRCNSLQVGCRVPSSLSRQYIPKGEAEGDVPTPPPLPPPPSHLSAAQLPASQYIHCSQRTPQSQPYPTQPDMTGGGLHILPPLGPTSSAHSPFSIHHPLFGEAGPSHSSNSAHSTDANRRPSLQSSSSRTSLVPTTSSALDEAHARRNDALLAALSGPLSGLSTSTPSNDQPAMTLSSLDAGGNPGSAFSASGNFPSEPNGISRSASSGGSDGGAEGDGFGSGGDDSGDAGRPGGDDGESGSKGGSEKDKGKKTNPLVDLLETEAAYVSELSKVIKKVAAAWSRSNFPPPELDTMFRNIEAIYRANRSFLKALKEIGPNPSSPKALGDLLMKWIDDLEAPYSRFCESYLADFDSWSTVQQNARLPILLAEVSGSTDNEGNPVIFSDKKRDPKEPWTLDSLFALPHIRLKYYKKLYSRLLKSTQPGRSDHRLLVAANEKLDDLVEKSKRRLAVSVLDEVAGRESRDSSFAESSATAETSPRGRISSATSASDSGGAGNSHSPDSVPVKSVGQAGLAMRALATSTDSQPSALPSSSDRAPTPGGIPLSSPSASAQMNGLSLQQPNLSQPRPELTRGNSEVASIHDSASHAIADDAMSSKTNSLTQPIENLESRLDTSKTIDIFTMKPKKCQLQIHPPNLPFQRSMRKSADVVIHFTPSSGGPEISIRRAHIFLLTDLFLVCERMTPSERAERSKDGVGPDMWLLYPPLAGKHLKVTDVGGQGNVMSIAILKKEHLTIHTESREAKEEWIRHFDDCQKFAANLGLKLKTGNNLAAPANANSAISASTPSPGASGAPGLSPAISITPSATLENEAGRSAPPSVNGVHEPALPKSDSSTALSRQASFNSVASFPQVPGTGSPDLHVFPSGASPRSPSPSQFSGPPASGMPGIMNGRTPPGPGSSGPFRPGMMSPSNGMLSPDTSPAFGPSRMGPGGWTGPGAAGFPPGHPGNMSRPPLMRDPNLPPLSPGGMNSMRGPPPPGGPNGFPPHRGGPSPIPGQRPGMPPGMPNGVGGPGGPGAGMGMPFGPGPGGAPFMNGRPRPPMPPGPPGAGPWSPPNQMTMPREATRRPSAPNLRQASQGSSGRSSDEVDGTNSFIRTRSVSSTGSTAPKLPSAMMKEGRNKAERGTDVSPPTSPVAKKKEPFRSTISAQMRCKLFLKQGHAQWKSLGNARLKLFHILPDDIKQLVVENDRKTLISTIVLTDGVERVGKVGVAVELSDRGNRTGIVYMLQMRSEESAGGLFGQFLEGSDRTVLAQP